VVQVVAVVVQVVVVVAAQEDPLQVVHLLLDGHPPQEDHPQEEFLVQVVPGMALRQAQINSRIANAFASVPSVKANSMLSTKSIKSFLSGAYPSSMLSNKPMGPLSTFSKVAPSLPTNKFTKSSTVAKPSIAAKPSAAPSKKQQDVVAATTSLVSAAAHAKSTGYCARYVANAIDKALGTKVTRPASAKDFGKYLEANGYQKVTGPMKVGDVQVYGAIPGHPNGHMQMKTATGFVSDFRQTDMYAGKAYRNTQQVPSNYRYVGK